jgi:hypothetical protein
MACKLTQQKLDEKNWLNGQLCTAIYTDQDGNIKTCGNPYADHKGYFKIKA